MLHQLEKELDSVDAKIGKRLKILDTYASTHARTLLHAMACRQSVRHTDIAA